MVSFAVFTKHVWPKSAVSHARRVQVDPRQEECEDGFLSPEGREMPRRALSLRQSHQVRAPGHKERRGAWRCPGGRVGARELAEQPRETVWGPMNKAREGQAEVSQPGTKTEEPVRPWGTG